MLQIFLNDIPAHTQLFGEKLNRIFGRIVK